VRRAPLPSAAASCNNTMPPTPSILSTSPDAGTLIRLKAVPGAKRDEIVGPYGDRLKVRVSQPLEGGKANAAIIELLAEALKISTRDISIVAGHASPQKTARVSGMDVKKVAWLLGVPD
jgi:uncharacterized protein (TIGR00251 family)